jgi:thiamine-phosphate pyrophosphorylase
MCLALKTGADGVHLSQQGAQRRHLRIALTKPGFFVTAAAHDRLALWRAVEAGADAVLLSPIFPTASHPGAKALGLWRFMTLARLSPLPIIALGGVHSDTARRLSGSAVHGFAAIEGWQP